MNVFRYRLTLCDPLFYSQDGLGMAKAPPHLHATAVNSAVMTALGLHPELHPFICRNDPAQTGDLRNVPRYENSHICREFYFTPARSASGAVEYVPEIVKSDGDGSIQGTGTKRYRKGEILRASKLFFIAAETEFEGYGFSDRGVELPEIIRIGSFRGKAILKVTTVSLFGGAANKRVEHPVDPLVSDARRGVLVNMFPYPLVEDAYCTTCLRIRLPGERFDRFIALPIEPSSEPAAVVTEGSVIV